MSALPPEPSRDQIQNEIVFTQLLLETLNSCSETYEDDKALYEAQLGELLDRLDALQPYARLPQNRRKRVWGNQFNVLDDGLNQATPSTGMNYSGNPTQTKISASPVHGSAPDSTLSWPLAPYSGSRKRPWSIANLASIEHSGCKRFSSSASPSVTSPSMPPSFGSPEDAERSFELGNSASFRPCGFDNPNRRDSGCTWSDTRRHSPHTDPHQTLQVNNMPGSFPVDPFDEFNSVFTAQLTNNEPTGLQYAPITGVSRDNGPQTIGNAYQANRGQPSNKLKQLRDQCEPGRTPEELKKLLENIRPDEDIPPEQREGTPKGMNTQLMEHQKLGLTWLKKMEEGSNKGGILADDMGLGKTVQALALILDRPSENPMRKTTLIIAPVALMRQWEREIQSKVKDRYALSVHIYHGRGKKRDFNKLRTYDVVLTTFGTLGQEMKKKREWEVALATNPGRVPTKRKLALLGDDCEWYR